MKKYLVSLVSSFSIIFMALTPVHAGAAGTAQFSLSPSSGSHAQNSTFAVTVFENGTDVNAVTANLTYAANLECTGVSGGTAFPNQISGSCGGGSVSIARYVAPGSAGVTGSSAVATISFKALAANGTGNVSFAGGSQIASNGVDIWNSDTTSNGANYTLTAPVVTPTPPVKKTTTAPKPSIITPSDNKVEAATVTPTSTTPAVTAPANKLKPTVATTTAPKKVSRTALKWAGFTTLTIGGSMFYQYSNKAKAKPVANKKK